jgi:hypothetical protein
MQAYILPAFLGVGLAASCGLRTFLPLFILAMAARFHWFGVDLNPALGWIGSIPALIALGVATAVEVTADKVPLLDHVLGAVGTVTRPIAGVLAASAVMTHLDPTTAAIAGLILGAPTALAVHSAQVGTRAVSTVTTAGFLNPVLSLTEEIVAVANVLLSLAAPILAPIVLIVAALAVFLALRRFRSRGGSAKRVDQLRREGPASVREDA